MNAKSQIILFVIGIYFAGCAATLRPPEITKRGDIKDYSFIVLPKSANLQSTSSSIYGGNHAVYGNTSSREISPSSIIEGLLLKRGLYSNDGIDINNVEKTLIIKYGESGRRTVAGGFGGYVLEVTIAIISAKTHEVVYSCVAEGQGTNDAEDIQNAIHRCLSGL